MPDIQLNLTEDEVEMIVDALEVDLEDYIEAGKEAMEQDNKQEAQTFAEAAQRVRALIEKVRGA